MTQTNEDGLVFALALDGLGDAEPIGLSEPAGDRPTWLHFDYSCRDTEQSLIEIGLSAPIAESLTRPDARPRTVAMEGGVLVLLRGVNTNPGADPEDMVSLRIWLEPNRMISVRQRRLLSVQDLKSELERGRGPTSVPELAVELIERLADRIASFVDGIEDRAADCEADTDDASPAELRAAVAELRRQTAAVRRFLAPLREALESLFRNSKGILDEDRSFRIREQSDRITRYVEDLDLVRERIMVVHEELLNRVAQEQNARVYLLSIVAAIFLPITFITGLFGMNVAGLPGVDDPSAFWLVAGIMAAVSGGVIVWLRLRRWL
jgi:zinc transporter